MAKNRDFIMARLAAARAFAQSTLDAIDACIEHFLDTDEDREGKNRKEALEVASDNSGEASRSIELAQDMMDKLKPADLVEEEPELEDEG